VAATALLNAGFACLTGAVLARAWLSAGLPLFLERLLRAEKGAALACLLGGAGAILAAAARMGDTGLIDALPMWWPVASGTAYGMATLLAIGAALLAALSMRLWRVRPPAVALLLVFAAARASVSHGGEGGWWSMGCMVQAVHLLLIGVWLGAVALAAWVILPVARRPIDAYLAQLSRAATVALAGIVLTGAWNSWQRLSMPSDLWSHPYGMLLAVKLALFAAAAMLGGWNRLYGFPRARSGAPEAALLVLRIESIVLAGALIAAAALVAQQPPA
ncbi:MAG TPA: CopD family protein, partial [Telluria sp.]|nr:CopD family protein [Telluria sp.]